MKILVLLSEGSLTVVHAVIKLVISIGKNTNCAASDGVNFVGVATSAIELLYVCGLLVVSNLWRKAAIHKCCSTILPNCLVKPSMSTIIQVEQWR